MSAKYFLFAFLALRSDTAFLGILSRRLPPGPRCLAGHIVHTLISSVQSLR
jgi:hypothetical protein